MILKNLQERGFRGYMGLLGVERLVPRLLLLKEDPGRQRLTSLQQVADRARGELEQLAAVLAKCKCFSPAICLGSRVWSPQG